MRIYLCGMIGSGKTTLGRRVAPRVGLDFYDLDQEMDRMLGYSFHRLVSEKGWVAFRELEYTLCKRFSRLENGLICLGGGTVRYEWNMDVLRNTGPIILLTASPEELIRRVRMADRPRVNPGTTLEEDIRRMWTESRDKYYAAADAVVDTENIPLDQTAEELTQLIRRLPA